MWIILRGMKTYTSNQVAELTGRTRRTVLQAAENHPGEIGRKHGRDWVFTDADIAKIRALRMGRPRTRRAAPSPAPATNAPAGEGEG